MLRWSCAVLFWCISQVSGTAQWELGGDYFGQWEQETIGLPPVDSLRIWRVREIAVVTDEGDSVCVRFDRQYRLKRVFTKRTDGQRLDRIRYSSDGHLERIHRMEYRAGQKSHQQVGYRYIAMANGWTQVIQTIQSEDQIWRQDTCAILERNGELLGMRSSYYGVLSWQTEELGDTTFVHTQFPRWNHFMQREDTMRYTIRTEWTSNRQPLKRQYIYHNYYADCGVGMMQVAQWYYDRQNRLVRYVELRGGYAICYSIDYNEDGSRTVLTECSDEGNASIDSAILLRPGAYFWPERVLDVSENFRFYMKSKRTFKRH